MQLKFHSSQAISTSKCRSKADRHYSLECIRPSRMDHHKCNNLSRMDHLRCSNLSRTGLPQIKWFRWLHRKRFRNLIPGSSQLPHLNTTINSCSSHQSILPNRVNDPKVFSKHPLLARIAMLITDKPSFQISKFDRMRPSFLSSHSCSPKINKTRHSRQLKVCSSALGQIHKIQDSKSKRTNCFKNGKPQSKGVIRKRKTNV